MIYIYISYIYNTILKFLNQPITLTICDPPRGHPQIPPVSGAEKYRWGRACVPPCRACLWSEAKENEADPRIPRMEVVIIFYVFFVHSKYPGIAWWWLSLDLMIGSYTSYTMLYYRSYWGWVSTHWDIYPTSLTGLCTSKWVAGPKMTSIQLREVL
jgi:hypothetical protein